MDGLRRLEYRGYDCAGPVHDRRRPARAPPRRGQARQSRSASSTARSAARPHRHRPYPLGDPRRADRRTMPTRTPTDEVAVVHNGIIENFKPLREELIAEGRQFESQTDTEVVAHLVAEQLEQGATPAGGGRAQRCRGSTAPSRSPSCSATIPDMLIGARLGSPLVVGYGERRDLSRLRRAGAGRRSPSASPISTRATGWSITRDKVADLRPRRTSPVDPRDRRTRAPPRRAIDKGNHRHFMLKEIFEQPIVVAQTLELLSAPARAEGGAAADGFRLRRRCRASPSSPAAPASMPAWSPNIGSSSSPGCRSTSMSPASSATASRCWSRAGSRSSSRNRARPPTRSRRCATPAPQGQKIAVVVNVPTSSMAREADLLLPTHAGPEIGVASTKAFTCQLAVLAALAAKIARDKGRMSEAEEREIVAPSDRGAGGDERRARP